VTIPPFVTVEAESEPQPGGVAEHTRVRAAPLLVTSLVIVKVNVWVALTTTEAVAGAMAMPINTLAADPICTVPVACTPPVKVWAERKLGMSRSHRRCFNGLPQSQ